MKKKVLDVRMPKEEQIKSPELIATVSRKKYQANVDVGDGKMRYMYGDDPVTMELFASSKGWKIIKTHKL